MPISISCMTSHGSHRYRSGTGLFIPPSVLSLLSSCAPHLLASLPFVFPLAETANDATFTPFSRSCAARIRDDSLRSNNENTRVCTRGAPDAGNFKENGSGALVDLGGL